MARRFFIAMDRRSGPEDEWSVEVEAEDVEEWLLRNLDAQDPAIIKAAFQIIKYGVAVLDAGTGGEVRLRQLRGCPTCRRSGYVGDHQPCRDCTQENLCPKCLEFLQWFQGKGFGEYKCECGFTHGPFL